MNQQDKQLLLTDLCGRLPYGVNVQTKKRILTSKGKPMEKAIGKLIGYSDRTGYEVVFNEDDFAEDFDDVKPIYFGLECLTQEITVAGETFVPLIRMAQILHSDFNDETAVMELTKSGSAYHVNDYSPSFASGNGVSVSVNPDKNSFWKIELFNQWHIDYRGLIDKGLAVSVYSLDKNPYE